MQPASLLFPYSVSSSSTHSFIHPSRRVVSLHRFFPRESTGQMPKGGVCIMQPGGAGPEVGVCLSADARINRPTPSSASDWQRSKTASLILPTHGNIAQQLRSRPTRAGVAVLWQYYLLRLPSYKPPSCKIVSSLWWWTARMLQSVNQSYCIIRRQCQWRCVF